MTRTEAPGRAAPPIVLASKSPIRAAILHAAGLSFRVAPPGVDEAAIKARLQGRDLAEIAEALAAAKALAVQAPGAIVIGSDQILEFEGAGFDKPASRAEAAARLLRMSGRRHSLINGLVAAQEGEIVFRHRERVFLDMRPLTPAEIEAYLDAAGPEVLSSVGAYQVEGLGARLFDRIEGDHFAVLGLPLLPLLRFLRERGLGAF